MMDVELSTNLEPEPASEPIRVLVVDDHAIVAEGLELALGRDPTIHVVGVASTAAEAVSMAREARPDVVLMDQHLPDGTGTEAAALIRDDLLETAIVMLTGDNDERVLLAAIESGACGYLLKSNAAPQVIDAVHRAAEGEMLIPAAVLAGLLGRQRRERTTGRPHLVEPLTQREQEVLDLMARGMDNRVIADHLIISYTTVRTHVQNVLSKLGAHSKLEALARANEYGLLGR
jgi:DNA-binding NarL/FixJ family response regulator